MGTVMKITKEKRRMCVKDCYNSGNDFVAVAEHCVSGLCPR